MPFFIWKEILTKRSKRKIMANDNQGETTTIIKKFELITLILKTSLEGINLDQDQIYLLVVTML